MRKVTLAMLIPLGVVSCGSDQGCVQLSTSAPLLEASHPMGYPSTKPLPNRVVSTLQPGEHTYSSRVEGKDYMAYLIRLPGGVEGYLIHDERVTVCR